MVIAVVNVCERPLGWCSDKTKGTFLNIDCDGDGITDNVCSDSDGTLWYTSSDEGCVAIRSPSGICYLKGSGMQQAIKICPRPVDTCDRPSDNYLIEDCDADGMPDNVCSSADGESADNGRLWYIPSSKDLNKVCSDWIKTNGCRQLLHRP